MARQPRIFLPHVSVHVIHRGNNRMQIFCEESDYSMFLRLLERATAEHRVGVHGYVLMTNHVHILVTPEASDSLPGAIKELAGGYARYYNDRYKRIGTLWNGRYRGILVDSERYWLTCLRYIEQNPVRAGMANDPADYMWSSYDAHAFGRGLSWLASHPIYRALGATAQLRMEAYRALCRQTVSAADIVPPHRVKGGQTRV